MQSVIQIFIAEITNAEIAFREYLEHKFKDVHKRDEPNLFSPFQDSNLDFKNLNEEISYKMRVFDQIVSVRNQVKSIIDNKQQIDLLLKLNGIILDTATIKDGPIELINPYINIIENEIFLTPLLDSLHHILIVYNPDGDDIVLTIGTEESKEIVAMTICRLLVEAKNDDWYLLNDLDAFISPSSLEFLKSIYVPLQKHIDIYNLSVIKGRMSELLQRCWDVYYKIVFKITDVEKYLSQDEVLTQLYDDNNCFIYEHSIEFHKNSDNDFTGESVHPLKKGHLKTLKEKLENSVYDKLSFDYENEMIQRLHDLSENQGDLVKLSSKTSFPFIEEIENLYDDMLNYIQ